jgi:hypothetical protein
MLAEDGGIELSCGCLVVAKLLGVLLKKIIGSWLSPASQNGSPTSLSPHRWERPPSSMSSIW